MRVTTGIFMVLLGALDVWANPLQKQCFTDTFDEVGAGNELPQTHPVGFYQGLLYGVFGYSTIGADSGIVPHSPPNTAGAGLTTTLLNGHVGIEPFGTLSIAGTTKSFDLSSFYFACQDDTAQAAVAVAESCTISVTGYYPSGLQTPVSTFAFANTNPPRNALVLAVLPAGFLGLKNVTFGIASGAVTVATTVLQIDNVVHCNYS